MTTTDTTPTVAGQTYWTGVYVDPRGNELVFPNTDAVRTDENAAREFHAGFAVTEAILFGLTFRRMMAFVPETLANVPGVLYPGAWNIALIAGPDFDAR